MTKEDIQAAKSAPSNAAFDSFSSSQRIAISGIGMVTPCGPDRETSWQGLISGQSRLRWLSPEEHLLVGCDPERTRLAGAPAILNETVVPCHFESHLQEFQPIPQTSFDSMLVQSAQEAALDAGLAGRESPWLSDQWDRRRVGLVIGTSKGSLAAFRNAYLQTFRNPDLSKNLSPQLAPSNDWPAYWPSSPATRLAARWAIRGPVLSPVAACATGMACLCRGAELIRDGVCDIVFAGSVDDSLSEILSASYRRLGVLARIPQDDPAGACRPFDRSRSGFLMGAGAAIMVLERWDSVIARGRRPYAEWLAGGTLSDGSALTQVSPDAAGLTRLIQDLLRRGNVPLDAIDYINLHGTGTRDNDRYETLGVRNAFGPQADHIPCSSLKGTIGHLLGSAGSVEFAATLLALRDGIIPPTVNLDDPAPECDLDYTPRTARKQRLRTAVKLSLGFGGHLVGGLIRRA